MAIPAGDELDEAALHQSWVEHQGAAVLKDVTLGGRDQHARGEGLERDHPDLAVPALRACSEAVARARTAVSP
jgi:hypothetical protein